MRIRVMVMLASAALWGGCSEDPAGGAAADAGLGGAMDAGPGPGEGRDGQDGGGQGGSLDGGGPGSGLDGGDGGNPLEGSRSDFCNGEGTVVSVGSGGDCAGDIAERTFQFAVCSCDKLEIGSRLTVDAFDSRRGPYGSTSTSGVNVIDDGHLGVNRGLITSGKVEVRGSIYAAGGDFQAGSDNLASQNLYVEGTARQRNSRTRVGRNAFVGGDVLGRFEIAGDLAVNPGASIARQTSVGGQVVRRTVPKPPVCQCDPSQLLDVARLTRWARDNNDNATTRVLTSTTWVDGDGPAEARLPCGRYYLEAVRHGGGLRIVAEDRTVLFVDGDFRVDGPLEITVEPGAEVDIFIAGRLSVGASIRFGDPSAPSAVRTYVGGDGLIDLQASAGFGGNLYAPRAHVDFGASARVYGAIFTSTTTFAGSAQVHFDRALRSAGDPCDDAGVSEDGGVSSDSGVGADGGGPDAAVQDGGSPDPGSDAGAPDVGEPGCTSCSECSAPSGCVIPQGALTGQCGPCQSDLDCCPPAVCDNGACTIRF